MHISTRTRFAIQMMVDMTVYESDGNVKIKDMARRQNISVKYMEQIVTTLSKAGYVKGERGPQGGYRLGVKADEITAGEIVRLMEGTDDKDASDGEGECPWISQCVEMGLWSRVNSAIDEILDGTTIMDLVDLARKEGLLDRVDAPEYYI